MNFELIKSRIEEWLNPELERRNLFLVDIKFPSGRQIEVYIDSDEGIHISECAEVSRFLEKNLDGSGVVPGNYILEVSSPGMDNPLKIPRQYKRRIGSVLEVLKTDGTMITGELKEADAEKIKLTVVMGEKKKIKATNKHLAGREASSLSRLSAGDDEIPAKEFVMHFNEIKRAIIQFKF